MKKPKEIAEYVTNPDGSVDKDTGLHLRRVKEAPPKPLRMTKKAAKQAAQKSGEMLWQSLQNLSQGIPLDELEKSIWRIVKPYVTVRADGELLRTGQLGFAVGTKKYYIDKSKVPEEVIETVLDAVDALPHIHSLRIILPNGSRKLAALYAFELGRVIERISIRGLEHFALKGRQQRQRAIQAGKSRAVLTAEQQRQAVEDIRTLVQAGNSQKAACTQLAGRYGVSWRTLKRYDDSAQ